MKLVFLSLTGNVRDFVERTGMHKQELSMGNPFVEIGEPYILIIPTYNDDIADFYQSVVGFRDNLDHLVGVAGSGSLNFGDEYCFTAKILSALFMKPLIATFELNGTEKDIIEFKKEVKRFEIT